MHSNKLIPFAIDKGNLIKEFGSALEKWNKGKIYFRKMADINIKILTSYKGFVIWLDTPQTLKANCHGSSLAHYKNFSIPLHLGSFHKKESELYFSPLQNHKRKVV